MRTVAVVGLGVGAEHARAFVRAGARLAWVHDHETARAEAIVRELGQGEVAPSFEAILADPAVDAVALATYDDDHAAQVVRALEANKHVFCEKPLCTRLVELEAIEAAWKKSGRHLASNLVLRAAPLYQRARETVRSGGLGRVFAFYGDYLYGRLSKITEGWRAGVSDYSVMLGGGVHLVDLLHWITGDRAVRVRSAGNRVATTGTTFRYHDFVVSTFDCESGMTAVISANFACVHRHQHVVRIFGTEGTLLVDDMGARIYRQRDPGGPPEMLAEGPLPPSKGALVAGFVAAARDRARDPEACAAETTRDFAVIRACLKADEALKAGDSREVR